MKQTTAQEPKYTECLFNADFLLPAKEKETFTEMFRTAVNEENREHGTFESSIVVYGKVFVQIKYTGNEEHAIWVPTENPLRQTKAIRLQGWQYSLDFLNGDAQ